jgi:pimeloyl-ACP methyl ester carboxylesterase
MGYFYGIKLVSNYMRKFNFKKRYVIYVLMLSYIIICQSCMMMRMNKKEAKIFFESSKIEYVDSTFTASSYKIHYVESGKKENPTLIFIHGSPGSWDAFKEYLKDSLLLKKYRLISIDRPGFGHSNFGNAQNLDIQSQRISEFIKTIDNKKPLILVGHSLGGPMIVKLAADNPAMYKQLVILSGAVDPNAEKPEKWRKVIKTIPLRYLIPGALRPSNDELWWLKKDLVVMKPSLKNVTCAVTIIHGTKDRLVPYANMAFMQKELVNAKIDTLSIKNADHFIPWSHYEIIRKALLDLKID